MDKVLINQEFHEDVVELVTEVVRKTIEEKDQELLERVVQEKIDQVYDENQLKSDVISEVEDMIDNAKSDMEDIIDDKVNEVFDDKVVEIEADIENRVRRETPKFVEKALVEKKVDKEELKEAVLELKEEWNKLIAEQVKYHFKILAGFMIDQSK